MPEKFRFVHLSDLHFSHGSLLMGAALLHLKLEHYLSIG